MPTQRNTLLLDPRNIVDSILKSTQLFLLLPLCISSDMVFSFETEYLDFFTKELKVYVNWKVFCWKW